MLKFVGMGLNLEVLEGFFMGGVRILGLGGWFFIFFILCFCFFFFVVFWKFRDIVLKFKNNKVK